MSLYSLQELRSYRAPTKLRHNANIRDVSDAVGIRRFADVPGLLDPADDETDEKGVALGHQGSAVILGSVEHPIKIFVGDLLAGQTRWAVVSLVILQLDDGLAQARPIGRRSRTDDDAFSHGAQFGEHRTREALLKDDLAIFFAADLGPTVGAIESFGASPSLGCQHRR